MLRILQHGCFGTRNYGDERSALAVRTLVRQTYPDAEFYLVGSDAAAIQKEHKDVADWATRDNWPKVEALMAKADLWIYGPGTVLGPNVMPRTLDLVAMGKPFIIWGAGAWDMIPPDSDGAKVVQAASAISVRDEFAFRAVCKHATPPVLIPDPMFGEAISGFPRTTWAVTVSWHLDRQPEALQERVLDVLADVVRTSCHEWIALPASWSETTDWDNDHALHRRLAQRVPLELVWPQSFEHLRQILANVELIVTSRLHMAIPVLGGGGRAVLFGQPKCEAMAQYLDVGYAGGYEEMTRESVCAAAAPRYEALYFAMPERQLHSAGRMRAFIERSLAGKTSSREGGAA